MIFRVQIYNFLETIRLAFQKRLIGEKAIAKLEDRCNRRSICFLCEFKKGYFKKYYRCTSCECLIITKLIFTTSECPEGKWGTLDY